jgi:predicted kinase
MCGLPQSGKSSEARQMGHPIVNRDSIRKTIGGSIRYFGDEKQVTHIERIMAESLFNAGHNNVVIDACHVKVKYRDSWQKWADKRGYSVYVYNVLTSLETCVARAKRNFPNEPNFTNIIRQMWEGSSVTIGNIPEKQSDNWN